MKKQYQIVVQDEEIKEEMKAEFVRLLTKANEQHVIRPNSIITFNEVYTFVVPKPKTKKSEVK